MTAALFTQFALAVTVRVWAAAVAVRANWQQTTAAAITSKRTFRPNIVSLFLSDFPIGFVWDSPLRRAGACIALKFIAHARTQFVPAINVGSRTAAADDRCRLLKG